MPGSWADDTMGMPAVAGSSRNIDMKPERYPRGIAAMRTQDLVSSDYFMGRPISVSRANRSEIFFSAEPEPVARDHNNNGLPSDSLGE